MMIQFKYYLIVLTVLQHKHISDFAFAEDEFENSKHNSVQVLLMFLITMKNFPVFYF